MYIHCQCHSLIMFCEFNIFGFTFFLSGCFILVDECEFKCCKAINVTVIK